MMSKTYEQTVDDATVTAYRVRAGQLATRATHIGRGVTVRIPETFGLDANGNPPPGWTWPISIETHPSDHGQGQGQSKRRLVTIDDGRDVDFDGRDVDLPGPGNRKVKLPSSQSQRPPGYEPVEPVGAGGRDRAEDAPIGGRG